MLEELRKNLKDWIGEGMLNDVFDTLTKHLPINHALYNSVAILQAKFTALKKQENLGLEDHKTLEIHYNKINYALLELIDDLGENAENTVAPIHYYHQYTCDRVEQSDCFREFFNQKKEQKVQYYYIFGVDVQSHRGLFKRLAYGLEGLLEDYLNPNLEATATSLKIELTFETSQNLNFYKENVLKSLFAACNISPNEQEPLLDKKLKDVIGQSPSIQGLDKDDFVSIFISITDLDWDAEVTPKIVHWFIHDFCNDVLPATAPTFVFFFAIIYEDDDAEVEQEIRAALDKSIIAEALPELNMVEIRDVKKWFAKYRKLAKTTKERKELIKKHFGHAKEFAMEDVEIEFQKIIDAYNGR